ncbi:MAG: flavin-containing monooxygenase [Bacteroidia bacterium]
MDNNSPQKYLIIGAGPVGLAYAKELLLANIPYQQVDADNDIGGNWYHGVYETAHVISSKDVMEYSDYPMPENTPDFPSYKSMLAYYRNYAEHFDLRKNIRFNTKVVYIQPIENSLWKAYFADGSSEIYQGVLICNGHHWDKKLPQWEGDFEGEVLHSKDYKSPDQLRKKKVVVIGAGNSACDIVSEAARVGEAAYMSIRSSAWFLPKLIMGQPLSKFAKPWVPEFMQRLGLKIGLKIVVGDMEKYGLPVPDHKVFEKHPTIGTEVLHYIKHGRITPKPGIAKLAGKKVCFTDGSEVEADLLVAATGYHLSYPFLPKELHRTKGAVALTYADCMLDDYKGLYLIGWQQARGGVGALAPSGAKLMVKLLKLQEQSVVPLGKVFQYLNYPLPTTHLIGMFKVLKEMEKIHKTFSKITNLAQKLSAEQPNFQNQVLPAPDKLNKDLVVY